MTDVLSRARKREDTLFVSQVVLAEWWRGRTDWREKILSMLVVEPLTDARAKLAGEAAAQVDGATIVDAIVRASAASRGDTVFTSDPADLERLRAFFPNVRVLAV
jgi:predicted nucleic acid-binding protein